jgi:hypothetical protein
MIPLSSYETQIPEDFRISENNELRAFGTKITENF